MAYQRRQQRFLRPVPKNCPFCASGQGPVFSDAETLRRYLSERGKILAHTRTGICSTHQRALGLAIKHARFLALLPYTSQV